MRKDPRRRPRLWVQAIPRVGGHHTPTDAAGQEPRGEIAAGRRRNALGLFWISNSGGRGPAGVNDKLNTVYSYHERTKHHLEKIRAFSGLHGLGQPALPVPPVYGRDRPLRCHLPAEDPDPRWDTLFDGTKKAPATVTAATIGALFYYSLALSAWKQVTDPSGEVVSRWALRVNPSSGNLHPTEGYLVDAEGVFHYAPDEHLLEKRGAIDPAAWAAFTSGLPAGSFLVGLTSIHWREAWKYGERAFRYCQHDVGHADRGGVVVGRMPGMVCFFDRSVPPGTNRGPAGGRPPGRPRKRACGRPFPGDSVRRGVYRGPRRAARGLGLAGRTQPPEPRAIRTGR